MAKEINIEVNVDGGKQVDKLNDSLETTNDELLALGETSDNLKDVGKNAGKSEKGLKKMAKGFDAIGKASLVIGLVVGAFQLLKEVLEKQQPVLDILDSSMNAINLAVTAVSGAIKDAFKSSNEATGGFDAMKEVVINLLKLAITPMKLSFFAIKGAIIGAQLVWEKSFFGSGDTTKIEALEEKLVEVKDDLIDIGKSAIDSAKSIGDNFAEAVDEATDFGNNLVDNIKKVDAAKILSDAQETTRLKNLAILKRAENELALITAARDAEIAREERDNIRLTFEERKAASDRLQVILDEQAKLTMGNAQLVLDAAEAELATNTSSIELQEKLILAKKELIDAEETVIGFRTEANEQQRALALEEIESINNVIDAQTESTLKFEQSELKKAQIVVDAAKLKKKTFEDTGDFESEQYKQSVLDLKVAEDDKLVVIKKAGEEAIEIIDELQRDATERQIQRIKDESERRMQALRDAGKLTKELQEQIAEETNTSVDKINKDARDQRIADNIAAVQEVANKAGQLATAITDIFAQIQQQQQQEIDRFIEEKNKSIEADFANQKEQLETSHSDAITSLENKAARELAIKGEVSRETQNQIIRENNAKLEADFALAQEEFEIKKEAEKEANKLRKDAFENQKTLSLAQAAISTALAVVNALATTPYPLGVGLAIAAGVAGAVQIAAISSQKFVPETSNLTAPKMPSLGATIKPQDQSSSLGLDGEASTGGFSADAQFNKQELFGVGAEGVGGGAGERQSIKVSVLESDITNTQLTVNTIESAAEFGG